MLRDALLFALCCGGDFTEHAVEYPPMYRIECVPVKKAGETGRIEDCGLPDCRATAVRFDFELQPGTPGNFHFRSQIKPMIRIKTLDSPEIQRVPRR